jgi:hypothetical protein
MAGNGHPTKVGFNYGDLVSFGTDVDPSGNIGPAT